MPSVVRNLDGQILMLGDFTTVFYLELDHTGSNQIGVAPNNFLYLVGTLGLKYIWRYVKSEYYTFFSWTPPCIFAF